MRPHSLIAIAAALTVSVVAMAVYFITYPTTLRIAVGPDDRDHARLMAAFAQRLSVGRAPINLKLMRKDSLMDNARAIDARETELAVVRSDKMPREGLMIAVLHRDPILFIAPPGSPVNKAAQLSGKRIGVLRLTTENRDLLQTILKQDHIDIDQVTLTAVNPSELNHAFRNTPEDKPGEKPDDKAPPTLPSDKKIDVLMMISPLQGAHFEQVMSMVARSSRGTPVIFGVSDPEAIVRRDPAMESYDIPRGAFGSAPARPADELTTVAVSHRLMAHYSVSDSAASDLTRLLFAMRTALASQIPLANSIEALDPDDAAALGLHPGARAYLAGEQQTFIQRYADWAYLGLTLLTMLASGMGGLLSYLSAKKQAAAAKFTHELQSLLVNIHQTHELEPLQAIQSQADHLLTQATEKVTHGDITDVHFLTFTIVYQNVRMAVQQREWQLRGAGATTTAS